MSRGKQKINLDIFLMIKILNSTSNNFKKDLEYFLNLRKYYSDSTINTVRKIVSDVRKKR